MQRRKRKKEKKESTTRTVFLRQLLHIQDDQIANNIKPAVWYLSVETKNDS